MKILQKIADSIKERIKLPENLTEDEKLSYYMSVLQEEVPEPIKNKSLAENANNLIGIAFESNKKEYRIKLAQEALRIHPECADAFFLLANNSDKLEDLRDFSVKAIDLYRKELGEEIFTINSGDFWELPLIRKYMDARRNLMLSLFQLGNYEEAISHAKELLVLNKKDNQGIRYYLMFYLLTNQRYEELSKFLNQTEFNFEIATGWLYTKALVTFILKGNSLTSKKELKIAIESNSFVPEYLTERIPIPADALQLEGAMYSKEVGAKYSQTFIDFWKKIPGAIEWLKYEAQIKIIPIIGRNDLCRCGSGKMYKKCCMK